MPNLLTQRRILRPFRPDQLRGLGLWLDADDSATITVATGVSRWADKSGNARDVTQTTTGFQPSYQAASLNGRNVVRFDGSDDRLVSSAYTISQPLTVFIVARYTSVASSAAHMFDGDTSRVAMFAQTNNLRMFAGSIVGTGTVAANTAFQATGIYNGASSTLRKDRAVVNATINPGSNAWTQPVLGVAYSVSATAPYPGDIAEIIAYSRVLTAGEIASVESYLSAKWGTP